MENRNDTKLAGSGSISGGIYRNVHVSGSGSLNGDIDCHDLHCSGSAHAYGSIHSATHIHCSGSFTCDGNVEAAEHIHISGSAKTKGSLRSPSIHVSGSLKSHNSIYGEEIKISGSLSAKENVEGEKIKINGGCRIDGNLNGENIELNLGNVAMHISSIGGAQIFVKSADQCTKLLMKLLNRGCSGLLISNLIEGDTIELANTECKIVRGKNVTILGCSKIDRVEYSESLTVEPCAIVTESEKI